jgi:hypothetical protein
LETAPNKIVIGEYAEARNESTEIPLKYKVRDWSNTEENFPMVWRIQRRAGEIIGEPSD